MREIKFRAIRCTIKYTTEYEILGNIYDNPELLKNRIWQ